ncbi:BEN domain-containing protein 6-like [Ptychodera flava]|uniref:BEN domain-containing protein 6-like n=1 Tax=Ptychodera flava TaxID=63121 RepID=UPI003969F8D1
MDMLCYLVPTFLDDKLKLQRHLEHFLRTGDHDPPETPVLGKGKRGRILNRMYISSDDDENDASSQEIQVKKRARSASEAKANLKVLQNICERNAKKPKKKNGHNVLKSVGNIPTADEPMLIDEDEQDGVGDSDGDNDDANDRSDDRISLKKKIKELEMENKALRKVITTLDYLPAVTHKIEQFLHAKDNAKETEQRSVAVYHDKANRHSLRPQERDDRPPKVKLGENLEIDAAKLRKCNTANMKSYTRDLMSVVFNRDTMASSSLTGKKSNAHMGKTAKQKLPEEKVEAIIGHVTTRFKTEGKEVKRVIQSKLNDEEKLRKRHSVTVTV